MGINQPTEANIESSVTIIWGVERGRRLALWRMKKFITQAQLGKLLGVKQQVICSIETGRMTICEHFTLRAFRAAVKDGFNFVLFGSEGDFSGLDFDETRSEFYQYQSDKMRHIKRVKDRAERQKLSAEYQSMSNSMRANALERMDALDAKSRKHKKD